MLRTLVMLGVLVWPLGAVSEEARTVLMHKRPGCGCCEDYANYLRAEGMTVTVFEDRNISAFKAQHGVTRDVASCHTMLIDGYVVEGHVPAGSIKRMLAERPAIKGISLPGMPAGSPGMTGDKAGPFTIYEIGADGRGDVFASE